MTTAGSPKLAPHVRLRFDAARDQLVLLSPETIAVLNPTSAAILELCDGRHTVADIEAELGTRYHRVPDDEVQRFLTRLAARRCVELAGSAENAHG